MATGAGVIRATLPSTAHDRCPYSEACRPQYARSNATSCAISGASAARSLPDAREADTMIAA
ncbi:hypothetical protein AWV80_40245 [Cupriavidus sp. UYMU48A]|nr:hypothetical protein AWV80_40245 [Cupriavidus sp. UYMU48A]